MNDTNNLYPFPTQEDSHEEPRDEKSPDLDELQEGLRALTEALSARRKSGAEQNYRLRNFRSTRYKLKDELAITIQERDGQFVTTSIDTDQYGHGFSQEDAIVNLCEVIEEYYEVLQEEEGNLSSILASHLRYLRDVLEARK